MWLISIPLHPSASTLLFSLCWCKCQTYLSLLYMYRASSRSLLPCGSQLVFYLHVTYIYTVVGIWAYEHWLLFFDVLDHRGIFILYTFVIGEWTFYFVNSELHAQIFLAHEGFTAHSCLLIAFYVDAHVGSEKWMQCCCCESFQAWSTRHFIG